MLPNIKVKGANNLVQCILLGSVWNCIRFDFFCLFCVCVVPMQIKRKRECLQLLQFSERRVAFLDRIARVLIFLAMTVYSFTAQ